MSMRSVLLSRFALSTITILIAQSLSDAQIITTFAGGGDSNILGDGGPAAQGSLNEPRSVAFDALGNLYIADYMNNRIRRVTPTGTISTVAGNGTADSTGDGGLATSAAIRLPVGVVVDSLGNIFFTEAVSHRLRRVDPTGIITTIAGNGMPGFSGDGGLATKAQLYGPGGLALDSAGNLYIADTNNQRVRKIDTSGIITTVAGNPTASASGDGGLATATRLSSPTAVAFDSGGNLLIAEGNKIRSVSKATGIISTVAGTGAANSAAGDGGPATSAVLQTPNGVTVDASGDIYIGDTGNNRIRKVDTLGIITTIAGGHPTGGLGDGGLAVNAGLGIPEGLAFDAAGNLYIADTNHNAIRKISGLASGPIITSVLNGASLLPGIAPNGWATIKGSNLSSMTDTWDKAVINGKLPTTLDGVSVTVGGQSAYIYYVSPGQINFVVPDIGFGPEQVIVSSGSVSSAPFTATSSQYSPAFFLWPGNQTVATRQDFSWAVKNGTFAGTATTPAKPGDVIILWGTGFGPTMPLAPSGVQIPSDRTYSTIATPTVTINNVPATVYGAALAPGNAALFQVAIQVPDSMPDGDWPIQASIGGAQSPASVLLSVHK